MEKKRKCLLIGILMLIISAVFCIYINLEGILFSIRSDILWVTIFIYFVIMLIMFIMGIFNIKRKKMFIIGSIMLLIEAVYIAVAINHPEISINIKLEILCSLYLLYTIITITSMIIGIFKK